MLPASVVTAEVAIVIFRILLLLQSATRAKEPSAEMETPWGALKEEEVPTPLALPEEDPPARVLTSEEERIIFRILLLSLSAMRA